MPAGLIAAGIAGASMLANSVLNHYQGMSNSKRANAENWKMAKWAYSKDVNMWNATNAYNNPVQQMNRLRDAGLNPNLVYGKGAVGNTTTESPKAHPMTMKYNAPPVQIPDMISKYLSLAQQRQEISNLQKIGENLAAKTVSEKTRNEVFAATAKKLGLESALKSQTMESNVKATLAKMDEAISNAKTAKERVKLTKWRTKFMESQAGISKEKLESAKHGIYGSGGVLGVPIAAADKFLRWMYDEIMQGRSDSFRQGPGEFKPELPKYQH